MVADAAVHEDNKPVAPTAEPVAENASVGSGDPASNSDDAVEDKDAETGGGALLTASAFFLAQRQPLPPIESEDAIGPAPVAANDPAPEQANGMSPPVAASAADLAEPAFASAAAVAAAAGTAELVASALGKSAEAPTADATIAALTAQTASESRTGKDIDVSAPLSSPSVSTTDVLTGAAESLAASKSGETSNAAASSTRTENKMVAQAGESSGAGDGAKAFAQTTGVAAIDAQTSAAAPSSTSTSAFAAQMQAQAQTTEPAAAATTDTAPTAQNQPSVQAASTQTAPVIASFSGLSRATLETTVQIAAQITRQLAGRSTRFEMGLTPEGLGKVNVSMDIDADGQLTARLAFDNPLAAADLRARADELRSQLQDAGFKLADDALTFSQQDTASRDGGGADQSPNENQNRAFAAASPVANDVDVTPIVPAWVSLSITPRGVDMKV